MGRFISLINQDYTVIAFIVILIIIVICAGINIVKNNTERKRLSAKPLCDIDKVSGEEFERILKAHFENLGYKVNLTPKSNDYGADLVLKKKGIKTIVQAKRYKGKVSNGAIQEIVAAKPLYNADRCMVITNSFYTKNAVKLANVNDVILWDRNNLQRNLKIK